MWEKNKFSEAKGPSGIHGTWVASVTVRARSEADGIDLQELNREFQDRIAGGW